MARVPLPPLMVLLVAALSPGGVPSPALAQRCDAANITMQQGETGLIMKKNATDITNGSSIINIGHLYVRPERGFQGLRLTVEGTHGRQHSAWFNAYCFKTSDKWQYLWVAAKIKDNSLHFIIQINNCYKECIKPNSPKTLLSLSIFSHGPSKWNMKRPPRGCAITYTTLKSPSTAQPTCWTSLTRTTTTTTTTTTAPKLSFLASLSQKTIIIIAASGAGILLVVVVVVVLVVVRVRRLQQQLAAATFRMEFRATPSDSTPQGPSRLTDSHFYETPRLAAPPRPPQGYESHIYDTVRLYDNVAPPGQAEAREVEFGGYENLAGPGQRPESPLYMTVI